MISSKDIREKDFATVNQGYDPDQVDDFLDALADQLDAIAREYDELEKKVETLSANAPAENSEPALDEPSYFKNLEATLRETLISAQRIADDTIAKAKTEAQDKISGAEEQAEAILSTAREEAETAKAEADTVRKSIEDYRARFRQLVEEQANVLKGVSFFDD